MPDRFVDRIGRVVIAGNLLRLDFVRLSQIDSEAEQVRQALACSPSASLSAEPIISPILPSGLAGRPTF